MNEVRSTELTEKQEEAYQAFKEICAGKESGIVETAELAETMDRSTQYASDLLGELSDKGLVAKVQRGEYDFPENVENSAVKEETEPYDTVNSNGQEQLPLLNERDLTSVVEGEDPLPEEVDKHIAVDNRLVEKVEESRQQAIARVPGNSIPSTNNSEDRVVIEIEEGCQVMQGGLYVWVNGKGGVIIMRAHWVDARTVRLVPENGDHSVIQLQGDRNDWEWTCIARVTQVLSGV